MGVGTPSWGQVGVLCTHGIHATAWCPLLPWNSLGSSRSIMRANRKHGGPAGVGISGTVLAPHWAQGLQSGWRARTPTEQLGSSLHPQMPEAVTPQASFKHSPPPPGPPGWALRFWSSHTHPHLLQPLLLLAYLVLSIYFTPIHTDSCVRVFPQSS